MKGVIWLTTGLMLSLLLVSAVSVGSQMSLTGDSLFSFGSSQTSPSAQPLVKQVNQLAAVTSTWDIVIDWLSPLTNWFKDFWFKIVQAWKHFLGLTPDEPDPSVVAALRAQLRQEILAELEGQGLTNGTSSLLFGDSAGAKFGIMVAPSSGSTTRDEWLKKSLSQMFADQVTLKFDRSGMSGLVTPTFRDGRKGGDYVFVLTPMK